MALHLHIVMAALHPRCDHGAAAAICILQSAGSLHHQVLVNMDSGQK